MALGSGIWIAVLIGYIWCIPNPHDMDHATEGFYAVLFGIFFILAAMDIVAVLTVGIFVIGDF